MAARPQANKGLKKSPSVLIIGLLVGALVVFVIFVARMSFSAGPTPPPMTKEAVQKKDRLTELAQQSGGDINKLSAEDKAWVNQLTGGRGADVLVRMAQNGKR